MTLPQQIRPLADRASDNLWEDQIGMLFQEEIYQAFEDYQTGRLQNADDNPWTGETRSQSQAVAA